MCTVQDHNSQCIVQCALDWKAERLLMYRPPLLKPTWLGVGFRDQKPLPCVQLCLSVCLSFSDYLSLHDVMYSKASHKTEVGIWDQRPHPSLCPYLYVCLSLCLSICLSACLPASIAVDWKAERLVMYRWSPPLVKSTWRVSRSETSPIHFLCPVPISVCLSVLLPPSIKSTVNTFPQINIGIYKLKETELINPWNRKSAEHRPLQTDQNSILLALRTRFYLHWEPH